MTPLLVVLLAIATPAERVDALLQKATALQSQQQRHADLAIPILQQVVALSTASGDTKHEVQALTQLGRAYSSTHQPERAFAAYRRGLLKARASGDRESEVDALAGLGGMHIERGEYVEAQAFYRAVLDFGTRYNDPIVRVRGLNGFAAMADRRGRSAEGAQYARMALMELDAGVRRGVKFPSQAFFSVPFNLGKALSEQGDYAQAYIYLERARSAAERYGMITGVWHVLQETGEMYRSQGDLSTAVRYFQRALAEANRVESHDPEAITLRELAATAEAHGDFGASLNHYQEALAIFEKAEFLGEAPQTLTMMSRVQFRSGDRSAARASLDRAKAALSKMDQPLVTSMYGVESGHQKFDSGDLAGAEADYLSALDTARKNNLDTYSASAFLGLAEIARARRDAALALQRYAAAADAIDATRSRIPSIEQRTAFVSATHRIYEGWVDMLLDAQQPERAFLVLERERSRNLLDALVSQTIERPAEARALNNLISSLQIDLTAPALTPDRHKLLLGRLDDAERKLDLLQTSTKAQAPFHADFRSLRGTLQKDEAWIEFAERPNRIIAFLVTQGGLHVSQHAVGSLESRVEFFNDLLNSANSEEAVRPGAALSRDLLGDVLPRVPSARRLIIGVAGELAALPFDALPDLRNPSKPLLARYEIAYAPSLALLAEVRDRHRSAPRYDLLGVAPLASGTIAAALPVYRSMALAPLPWSGREVSEIAHLLRGHADELVGASATEQAFKHLRLRDYKVIHLATHALLDPQFPSRSGIVFSRGSSSDDGWLQMREIYQLDLSGQLVVLSACQTAFGAVSSAEGMHSLARAFTYAGANAVVGTLWKVQDTAAAAIVQDMYSAISRGQSISAALRTAQLRAAGPKPYRTARDWAGWVATGDASARPDLHPPILQAGALEVNVLVAITALLIGGFLFQRRRLR
ncbi:MAG: CHAT domain-containing protein [Acidobacteriota bacterium]|nr:CHAT domain-containing protein [Acidobacteriota bacterium]